MIRGGLWAIALGMGVALAVTTCASPSSERPRRTAVVTATRTSRARPAARKRAAQRGMASWYGGKFHGRKTASGERFNKRALTAAHRTLPFGTRVRVTNLKNNRSVTVRVNDRGPFGKKKRIIDVSEAAARKLGMIRGGVAPVLLEVLRR